MRKFSQPINKCKELHDAPDIFDAAILTLD